MPLYSLVEMNIPIEYFDEPNLSIRPAFIGVGPVAVAVLHASKLEVGA
jgi:hypothetical protein